MHIIQLTIPSFRKMLYLIFACSLCILVGCDIHRNNQSSKNEYKSNNSNTAKAVQNTDYAIIPNNIKCFAVRVLPSTICAVVGPGRSFVHGSGEGEAIGYYVDVMSLIEHPAAPLSLYRSTELDFSVYHLNTLKTQFTPLMWGKWPNCKTSESAVYLGGASGPDSELVLWYDDVATLVTAVYSRTNREDIVYNLSTKEYLGANTINSAITKKVRCYTEWLCGNTVDEIEQNDCIVVWTGVSYIAYNYPRDLLIDFKNIDKPNVCRLESHLMYDGATVDAKYEVSPVLFSYSICDAHIYLGLRAKNPADLTLYLMKFSYYKSEDQLWKGEMIERVPKYFVRNQTSGDSLAVDGTAMAVVNYDDIYLWKYSD
jgi:hypothetical protein